MSSLALLALIALVSATKAASANQQVPDEQYFGFNPEMGQRLQRRQITYPQLEQQPAGPMGGSPPGTGNVLSFLSQLGPQLESAQNSAKKFTSPLSGLFNTNPQQAAAQSQLQQAFQPGQPPASPLSGIPSAAQVMGELSELIRSTQDRSAKAVSGAFQPMAAASEQMSQQSAAAASQAQGGIQSALQDIGKGLQRIAMNNPMLLPDVKNLYQTVSSKLSSASNSVAQTVNPGATSAAITPAKTSDQLADNLAKVALPGLQTPIA